ncbi:hypothetical protein BV509_00190 [Rhodovulum sulfidophilum]|uniref:Uncharacterized protein n=1 Tax=Rhodovulum visakhapatnamense TaxID=364297 RepID=A0ABS1RH47_9RHOB|nr:hypothetical protein [Rhodovulum visakhapatnamense]MBL3569542.1 hypothetical protein [Rhodovulum visakhapatnamense]MBL3578232.1 hypothetical protein [Rhodovulum visakhapatnamense]OLS42924.1 hypothetical protein BV509_00190 [Rhodovulum sulfidophilum]
MQKLYAIACVIGWGFFYAFAYLAVASLNDAEWMSVIYGLLSFAGFVAGMLCWVRLVRGKRPVIRTMPTGVARVRRPL